MDRCSNRFCLYWMHSWRCDRKLNDLQTISSCLETSKYCTPWFVEPASCRFFCWPNFSSMRVSLIPLKASQESQTDPDLSRSNKDKPDILTNSRFCKTLQSTQNHQVFRKVVTWIAATLRSGSHFCQRCVTKKSFSNHSNERLQITGISNRTR